MGFLTWLESTAYSEWILSSDVGWPLMLTIHALGLATVVGIVFSLNLRVLGLYESIPLTSVAALLNFAWIGIAANVITGLSLFMTQASQYVQSGPFLTKITFIVLGIGNLWYMQKVLRREAAGWESAGTVPSIGVVLASSSLVFWIVAVITGRLIAYL